MRPAQPQGRPSTHGTLEDRRVTYPVALMRAVLAWLVVVPGGTLVLVRGFGQGRTDADGSTFGLFALLGCLGLGLSVVAGARALVVAHLQGPAAALTLVALVVVTTAAAVVGAALAVGVLGSDQALALAGGSVIGWVAAVSYVLMLGAERPAAALSPYDLARSRSGSGWNIR